MFVRWQLYHSQALNHRHREQNDKRARLKAILVESVRVDGKPRQRHIVFLGSISIDQIGKPGGRFWYDVTRRLNGLGKRVTPADRKRIGRAIAKKVGGQLMTPAELKQWERETERMLNPAVVRSEFGARGGQGAGRRHRPRDGRDGVPGAAAP
jgi:hypothetical protein